MRLRVLSVALLLFTQGTDAVGGETGTRRSPVSDIEAELVLPAGAISLVVDPTVPDVRACWLKYASPRARADGTLRIEIIVDPVGVVWRHVVAYAGARNRRLDRCLSGVVETWRFPMRRGYTQAKVPFLFRASVHPGAGPFPSCWSPRGCRQASPRPPRQ